LSANNEDFDLNRESFSGRICDDLCEVLLSYLSFEDKIRFECVSKQWQKLIYNKQYILEVNETSDKSKNCLNSLLKAKKRSYNLNIKAFESILKKCKFINKVIIRKYNVKNREQVLRSITSKCNHLNAIKFDFREVDEKVLLDFGKKFRPKLRQLEFVCPINKNKIYMSLIKMCPNLLSLSRVKLPNIFEGNELLMDKLIKVDKLFIQIFEINLLQVFVEKYGKSFKSFGVMSKTDEFNEKNLLLQEISRFESLEHLVLDSESNENISHLFADNLSMIGNNCSKIQSLVLKIPGIQSSVTSHLFKSLGHFNALKKLDLNTSEILDNNNNNNNELNESISVLTFGNCKQLKHLLIKFPKIDDNFFKDIELSVPQLKSTEEEISDNTFKCLAKLKALKSLVFNRLKTNHKFMSITDNGVIDVINNCPELESIRVNSRPNISHKTIEALIDLALSKPRLYFSHTFSSIDRKYNNCVAIYLSPYKPFPINLEINLK
jgi:hypothetical protein